MVRLVHNFRLCIHRPIAKSDVRYRTGKVITDKVERFIVSFSAAEKLLVENLTPAQKQKILPEKIGEGTFKII